MDKSQQESCTKDELLEKEVLANLPRVLRSEMTLVDINANKGQWVFHSSKIIKKGIIYAIEPDSRNFNELKSNCLRWERLFDNNVSMYALPIAISDTYNVISPVTTDSSTSDMKHGLNEVALDVNVESYDLDTLFEPINPDLIKMINVKGRELRIIKGAGNILKKGKAKFLIQVSGWHDTDGQNSLVELYDFMKSFGYYPKKIYVWNLFVNRKKYLLYLIKRIGRRLLIG
jgi:FkbM family methyltransferase